MTTPKEEKKTRTPRSYESIKAGAVALTLQERVDLRDALNDSIKEEVQALKTQAELATKIAGNLFA